MSEQSQKLDINIVNPEELMTLQGIGPQLASRIIAARPFSDLEDMRRVEGIGSQTIESLKPFIIFTQPANIEEIHTVESRVNSEIHLESEVGTVQNFFISHKIISNVGPPIYLTVSSFLI